MIGITKDSAIEAYEEMTTEGLGATFNEFFQRRKVTWKHSIAEAIEIIRSVFTEDLCNFGHCRSRNRDSEISHQLIDGCIEGG